VSSGTRPAAVQAGVGVAHLLCFLADEDGGLERLRPPEPVLETGLWLLTHEDLRASRRVSIVFDHLTTCLAAYARSSP
jgi:DNA-binding transcriptional LysR family regulator